MYIGVDGGGSGTRAVLMDGDGNVLARAEGGPAVARAHEPDRAVEAVLDVCRRILENAGHGPDTEVEGLWAGLSGAGREDARRAVEEKLRARARAERVHVGTDVEASFHHAFGANAGVLLISGTGSIAWGRDREGRHARAGGWGPVMGDEGSAYAVAVAGLRAVARAADGRGSPTNLTESLIAAVGVDDLQELVTWAHASPREVIGALAPRVVEAAAAGDDAARSIVAAAVRDLTDLVTAVLRALGAPSGRIRVALAGGLLRPGRPLRTPVEEALRRLRFQIRSVEPDPALGAALLARDRSA
ncbi:MAG: N-acetylglucosamine kinase [Gemmatimonadota bacterium]